MKPETKENLKKIGITLAIIVVIGLILWIPIKYVPLIFSGTTQWVSTTLYPSFVEATSTQDKKATTTTYKNPTEVHYTNNTNTNQQANNTVVTYPTYYGKSDLQITFFDSGKIDPYTKQFVKTSNTYQNDEIAIRFVVKNIGTNVSGQWRMRINMPSLSTPTFDSPYQVSLKPGDALFLTSTFNNPNGQNIATLYVDPFNEVSESSETNNNLTVSLFSNNQYPTPTPTQTFSAYCYASPQTNTVGNAITWYASASGGNGNYTYTWLGTDSLSGNSNSASKYYTVSGTKNASVVVSSNGYTTSANCSAVIY